MIPFPLQVLIVRIYMFFLKIGTALLPFRKPRLYSGPGSALQLCDALARDGHRRVLLVTDAMLVKIGLVEPMRERLASHGLHHVIYDGIKPDPTIEQIETGLEILQHEKCDAILAIGGGSSIDAAKVIAARATNKQPISAMAGLFRVWRKLLPLYVIPTTSGTGSEVTIAAVVSDPAQQRKFAIMAPRLVPLAAALDGSLMTGLPPPITAATGMDALTHAVEAYISRNALPSTDRMAIEATQLIMDNLPRVMAEGGDVAARQRMAEASYKAGVAFTKAGVGYVHAIAHNFGARYHVPHGLANAIVLPYVLDYSRPNCVKRLARLAEVSGLKQGNETEDELADRFIAHVRSLNAQFGVPTQLDKLQRADIPGIADAALAEARWTYAVPRYMDQATCESVVGKMLVAA